MIWIGGAPGAGKSTLARLIAIAHDLPLHPIDRWTYVHAALQPGRPLTQVLGEGPESAADAFLAAARDRLPLVLSDVAGRDLGHVPAIVEGPQLLPELAAGIPPGSAIWLIPDTDQTRRARLERLQRVDDPNARQLLDGLLQRDEVIAERMLAQARATDRPVIKVGTEPDWSKIRDSVERALLPALDHTERLPEGDALARQRRFENAAAAQQITLWAAAEGITPDPTFAFACECGGSGCALTWSGTASDYRRRAEAGQTLAEPHVIN